MSTDQPRSIAILRAPTEAKPPVSNGDGIQSDGSDTLWRDTRANVLYVKKGSSWVPFGASTAVSRAVATGEKFVGIPGLDMIGATTPLPITASVDFFQFFRVQRPVAVTRQLFAVTTGPSSAATFRTGLYRAVNWQESGDPLWNESVAVASGFTGTKDEALTTPITLDPDDYCLGVNVSHNMTVRPFLTQSPLGVRRTLAASSVPGIVIAVRTHGAFPDGGTAWEIANADDASYQWNYVLLDWDPT